MNKTFGFIGLISTILGFVAKAVYREYVNTHAIHDYGIADVAPSFFYVIGFSQLLLIRPNQYPYLLVLVVSAASIAFEVMQHFSGRPFDWGDTLASLIGGLISAAIVSLVNSRKKQ